ncbi:MAG: glycosyltransferase [Christensenellales bacterium]
MPYSSISGKVWTQRIIKRLMKRCCNKTILDVGSGTGCYYDLLKFELPNVRFVGLEIWTDYIEKYELEKKYDEMIQADIREFEPKEEYGITILGDILEHMTKDDAIKVYEKVLKSSEFVVISIPVVPYPQDEYMGNPYEKHIKDDWSHNEVLLSFHSLALSYLDKEIGIYIGYNTEHHKKDDVVDANKPTYVVYGIYKNEERSIDKFLNSVRAADEIVLCDTGSDDNTNTIIRNFKDRDPAINLKTYRIFVSPWRFDDARNAAMSLVSKDIDICISLDMDEYLMENWRDILDTRWDIKFTRYYHKFKTLWSPSSFSAHWHDRIHARKGYIWRLPVHEILEYKENETIGWIDNLWVYHEPDLKKSRASYLPMLEQSAKERPDVWKTWSFLASEYIGAGRYQDANDAIDKAFALSNSDKGYLYKMKYHLYKQQGKHDMALCNLNNCILSMPERREPYFEKAWYLHQLGKNAEAYFTLKDAQKRTGEITDYHHNANSWGENFNSFMLQIAELAKEEGVVV